MRIEANLLAKKKKSRPFEDYTDKDDFCYLSDSIDGHILHNLSVLCHRLICKSAPSGQRVSSAM